jgi:hypothetical protein
MIKQCNSLIETLPASAIAASAIREAQQNPAICTVLRHLQEANESANACGREAWDFAVELAQFSDLGISTHILRLMICRNWITHMREIPSHSNYRRVFEPESDLVLSRRSCFLLTKKGLALANSLSQREAIFMKQQKSRIEHQRIKAPVDPRSESAHPSAGSSTHPVPCWDRKRRELRIGGIVVKRFKWPAENQEQVLDAFEEEGWPPRIDDPLLPHPKIDPKRRLHDTLKCLNRKQLNGYDKFRGDGTGKGVLLEINWDGSQ